jgi:hypothetical protein
MSVLRQADRNDEKLKTSQCGVVQQVVAIAKAGFRRPMKNQRKLSEVSGKGPFCEFRE